MKELKTNYEGIEITLNETETKNSFEYRATGDGFNCSGIIQGNGILQQSEIEFTSGQGLAEKADLYKNIIGKVYELKNDIINK